MQMKEISLSESSSASSRSVLQVNCMQYRADCFLARSAEQGQCLTDRAHLQCSSGKLLPWIRGAAAVRSSAALFRTRVRAAAGMAPCSSLYSAAGKLPYRLGTSLGSTFTQGR